MGGRLGHVRTRNGPPAFGSPVTSPLVPALEEGGDDSVVCGGVCGSATTPAVEDEAS